jgi:hypothetical protein
MNKLLLVFHRTLLQMCGGWTCLTFSMVCVLKQYGIDFYTAEPDFLPLSNGGCHVTWIMPIIIKNSKRLMYILYAAPLMNYWWMYWTKKKTKLSDFYIIFICYYAKYRGNRCKQGTPCKIQKLIYILNSIFLFCQNFVNVID